MKKKIQKLWKKWTDVVKNVGKKNELSRWKEKDFVQSMSNIFTVGSMVGGTSTRAFMKNQTNIISGKY